MLEQLTISALKTLAATARCEARFHAQVEAREAKTTREGKPYYEVAFADAEARCVLRAWSDGPAFEACVQLGRGDFVEIAGAFSFSPQFGLDARQWSLRHLEDDERETLLGGPAELRERQKADYDFIHDTCTKLRDPRLCSLARQFFQDFGDRFRRTAAARSNHHARRGGLVEHVGQMMRSAVALAGVYPQLNRDLLVAGVLFHDCGKLWENQLPAAGFTMPFDERGELLGHITIGIELVNSLWRKLHESGAAAQWAGLDPASEDVRLHLLHLIASHHGELAFGSPVPPKTPEGWALHYVDNLDAKMEMMSQAYRTSRHLAERIQEKVWPLPGNLVTPLQRYTEVLPTE